MLLTGNRKPEVNSSPSTIILKCMTISGDEIFYISEKIAYNNLTYLDINNQPLRCYRVVNPYSNILIRNHNEDLTHLHLNQLLSYTNVSKKYNVIDGSEFNDLSHYCKDCERFKNKSCQYQKHMIDLTCINFEKKHNKILKFFKKINI